MHDGRDISGYELRLIQELEKIERQLKELCEEREALRRQLIKARSENISTKDVNRKNSANRIIIENHIIEYLESNNKQVKLKKLYEIAKEKNMNLKENSFRTILHRMKERGLIENKSWGYWIIT